MGPRRMSRVVLDASALVALTLAEPGGAEVRSLLRAGGSISAVNIGEALDLLCRARGDPDVVAASLDGVVQAGLNVVECDWTLARRAAELRARHYHRRDRAVSLADCFAIAVAERLGQPLVSSDADQCRVARAVGVELHPIANSRGVRPQVDGPS